MTGQAACFLCQGKTEEAEAALQEALEKDPNSADTLVDLMVLCHHTGGSTDVSGGAGGSTDVSEQFRCSYYLIIKYKMNLTVGCYN